MCLVSNCCGAYSEYAGDIDICPDCLEHCEFEDEEEDEDEVEDLRDPNGEN
jgi:hypothetical protein